MTDDNIVDAMQDTLLLPQQQVNLDVPVYGKDLDMESYEKKFLVWDRVIAKNYLMSENYDIKNKAMRLFNDETIFAYAYFRDNKGKSFRYTAYQDLIASLKHDFTPDNPNRYILFKASNQIGKSQLLIIKALKIMMTEENRSVVMVSRSLPQSQRLLSEVKYTLNNSTFANTWKEDLGDQKNTTILTFKKEKFSPEGKLLRTMVNRIICAPAGEGLLGYPVDYLFLDELDFYEDAKDFFWRIALPRTLQTNGQIIVFSNPNTEIPRSQSILWELCTGDLFKRKFTFNFLDAPWNTQEMFDKYERNVPSHVFISTHMGEFAEEGGAFLSHKEIQDTLMRSWVNVLPAAEGTVYCALDLGKMNDPTVISIGIVKPPSHPLDKYSDLDCPYQQELPLHTGYDEIMDRMIEIREHYERIGVHVFFGHDSTGQKTFGDFLRKNGVVSQEVDFSKKESNKTMMCNDFKLMVEQRKLKVVYSDRCEKQLSDLVFKYTESKKLKKVENKSVVVHDDYFDSLLILVHLAVKPHVVPVTAIITKPKLPMDEEDGSVRVLGNREAVIAQTIKRNNLGGMRRMDPYG